MFAAGIVDAEISGSAAIKSTKVLHVTTLRHTQTGNIIAATEYLTIVNVPNARVLALEASITETAAGGDRTVTLDLKKSTGGGAFATILSSTLVFNSGDALRTIKTAALATPDLVDGDMLQLTVTIAGTTGAVPQGLLASLHLREDPQ